jgi:hypothetical protein
LRACPGLQWVSVFIQISTSYKWRETTTRHNTTRHDTTRHDTKRPYRRVWSTTAVTRFATAESIVIIFQIEHDIQEEKLIQFPQLHWSTTSDL